MEREKQSQVEYGCVGRGWEGSRARRYVHHQSDSEQTQTHKQNYVGFGQTVDKKSVKQKETLATKLSVNRRQLND